MDLPSPLSCISVSGMRRDAAQGPCGGPDMTTPGPVTRPGRRDVLLRDDQTS
ncbi:hypothetical protein Ae406Ps2_4936 [Pseudonocardia sp. Ae406_Ps2]|nr:hypothetical protein Ae331Ps2_1019c [Pseudonocardia sp. Ae331_Ps2]OLM04936.1 hypothetical protein Ae406Ps2_4936 [Pseudonocardia sp. Ae406_Ps2]OLM26508.1 hypothetical protein Ae706Ps2_4941 [Pseudonocardia sp. Ae706_Ps2]